MGDKSTAKATMQKVGVPTIPGSEGLLRSTWTRRPQPGGVHGLSRDDQGDRRWRWSRDAPGPLSGPVSWTTSSRPPKEKRKPPSATPASTWRSSSTGPGTLRCRCWPTATETWSTCRGAGLLHSAASPESCSRKLPSVAIDARTASAHGRGRRRRSPHHRLRRRRHRGVPGGSHRQLLFHGDEHPDSGRASRDRDGHAVWT